MNDKSYYVNSEEFKILKFILKNHYLNINKVNKKIKKTTDYLNTILKQLVYKKKLIKNKDNYVINYDNLLKAKIKFENHIFYIKNKDNIKIDKKSKLRFLQGDVVLGFIYKRKKDLLFHVVKHIQYTNKKFLCYYNDENIDTYYVLENISKNYKQKFLIDKEKIKIHSSNNFVVIFKEWRKKYKYPIVNLYKKISFTSEIDKILFINNINFEFNFDLNNEFLEEIYRHNKNNRKDLSNLTTITIDPVDAKDFDDAISVKQLKNRNWQIGIHIADVSHYVTPNSKVDLEAMKRCFTLYLPHKTIPMLPEILCNNYCSLIQGKDKLTFSYIFEIDKNGNLKNEWFGKTIIKPNVNLTYDEAQDIIDGKIFSEYYNDIIILLKISRVLKNKRIKNSINITQRNDLKIIIDNNNKPTEIILKKNKDSNYLIEEFMLLCNKRVGEYIYKNYKKLGLYRVHSKPNIQNINNIKQNLINLGYINEKYFLNKENTVEYINNILYLFSDKKELSIIENIIMSNMPKAFYSNINLGHFGLGFNIYTHFTSPIRRYTDILTHRLLYSCLNSENNYYNIENLENICNKSSYLEKKYISIEREFTKYFQTIYMSNYINCIFNGIIVGIQSYGFFVQLDNTCEGLIKYKTIKFDYFIYNKKENNFFSYKSNRKYKLGDVVKVKILKVNIHKRQINFALLNY